MGNQKSLGLGESILRLDEHPISEYFGCNTFNDAIARTRLSHSTYHSLKSMSAGGGTLTPEMAQEIALDHFRFHGAPLSLVVRWATDY